VNSRPHPAVHPCLPIRNRHLAKPSFNQFPRDCWCSYRWRHLVWLGYAHGHNENGRRYLSIRLGAQRCFYSSNHSPLPRTLHIMFWWHFPMTLLQWFHAHLLQKPTHRNDPHCQSFCLIYVSINISPAVEQLMHFSHTVICSLTSILLYTIIASCNPAACRLPD